MDNNEIKNKAKKSSELSDTIMTALLNTAEGKDFKTSEAIVALADVAGKILAMVAKDGKLGDVIKSFNTAVAVSTTAHSALMSVFKDEINKSND